VEYAGLQPQDDVEAAAVRQALEDMRAGRVRPERALSEDEAKAIGLFLDLWRRPALKERFLIFLMDTMNNAAANETKHFG